jgi:hypothetical protein
MRSTFAERNPACAPVFDLFQPIFCILGPVLYVNDPDYIQEPTICQPWRYPGFPGSEPPRVTRRPNPEGTGGSAVFDQLKGNEPTWPAIVREGLTRDEREELKRLQRENRELKKANEILRLASAFFAQAESPASARGQSTMMTLRIFMPKPFLSPMVDAFRKAGKQTFRGFRSFLGMGERASGDFSRICSLSAERCARAGLRGLAISSVVCVTLEKKEQGKMLFLYIHYDILNLLHIALNDNCSVDEQEGSSDDES